MFANVWTNLAWKLLGPSEPTNDCRDMQLSKIGAVYLANRFPDKVLQGKGIKETRERSTVHHPKMWSTASF